MARFAKHTVPTLGLSPKRHVNDSRLLDDSSKLPLLTAKLSLDPGPRPESTGEHSLNLHTQLRNAAVVH